MLTLEQGVGYNRTNFEYYIGGTMARLSVSILMIVLLTTIGFGAGATDSLKAGKADLKSASQLAFGPEGILFVGDSRQAAVFAIATEDTKPAAASVKLNIKAVNEKIAALLGIPPDQLLINDMKVNPLSHKVYIAVSRGRGPDGIPVILRIDGSGTISEFPLNNVRYSMVTLPDAPEAKPDASIRGPEGKVNANPRVRTIHDLSYVDGKVLVAGLSNEEFASDLRSIPFPFKSAEKGSGIRIWHSAHGRYETASPVRTFVPYTIDKQQYILASYSCTPLVKIPVNQLKSGAKVQGTTIAELGENSTPLDMFSYQKDGHNYILMATTTRGVMKLTADGLGAIKPITPPTAVCEESTEKPGSPVNAKDCRGDIAGVPYQTVPDLKGVWQLAKLDNTQAVVLADKNGPARPNLVDGNATWFTLDPTTTLDLTTISLP
jgi:hypothetical protein